MALGFTINDTTYAGEVASQFILKALTGNDTVSGGHIYVKDGIKKKFTIPTFDADYEDFIQDTVPTPSPKGAFTVDKKTLEPKPYMIYTEFDPNDFADHWYATQLNKDLIDRALPYTVESVVVQAVLARHAKYMNKQIWNGDTSTAGIYKYYDGIITKAVADSTVVDVASPTTLTASNIVAELEKGYVLIPDALKQDASMKIFMSYASFELYEQAQTAQTYKGNDFTQRGKDTYKGLKIVRIADFPANTYFIARGSASRESNLWLGLNSVSDEGLKLAPLQANSDLWFIKMKMEADVNFGWGAETVLYKA
jgi:hypothetical protein